MTTDEVMAEIARGRARLLSAIDALGDGAATVAVTAEGWTAEDVLAHLIHWLGQVAFGLGASLQPPAYVMSMQGRPSGEEWNAMAVEFYRGWSPGEVRAEFERLADALVERTRLRSNDEMKATDAITWAPGLPLWQFIGGDTFLHWSSHAEAIEEAAGAQLRQRAHRAEGTS
jgi:hypothetical protein